MNKHLHRIVFNEHRGQFMVVAEIDASHGGAACESVAQETSASRRLVTTVGAISLACLCAVGSVAWLMPAPASAQVVAYRNAPATQQPTILQTSNGVPQVNIQTPSAAGVSRNLYSQFDVNTQGLILNNSRTNAQTQLGGWVQGNPWLANGSAKVILNEVYASNPSYLNGYVEVAGQRAEVVIANPAGISVNGGGFINASKATLTTGTTILNNGSLDGYRVQGGSVTVQGEGLDLTSTDYAAIVTRSVQVNAGIWANELKVVTGVNEVDAKTLGAGITPQATPQTATGTAPTYALDVAQLGGMYAGKITLIGTEAGVGVRNAGTLGASAGDLVLQANGVLTNMGTLRANGNANLSTEALTNDKGTIASAGNAVIRTTQDIHNNQGLITATQTLTLQALNITNTEKAEISANQTQVKATQSLTNRGLIDGTSTEIDAETIRNVGAGRIYGDHISIAARQLSNDAETVNGATQSAVIAARDRLDLGIEQLINREHALIYSNSDMAIGGALDANRQATGQATQTDNLSATIEAEKNLSLATTVLNNKNMHFSSEVQEKSKTSLTELEGSGALKRYNPDDAGVEIFNDESDHLRTPDGTYENWSRYQYTRTISETVVTSTDPSKILVGGDFTFKGETLNNDHSQLLAGGAFKVAAKNLNNLETKGVNIVNDVGSATSFWRQKNKGRDSTGSATTDYKPADVVTEIDLKTTQYISSSKPSGSGVAHAGVGRNTSITSSMYKTNPAADASYLIESDPRFANQKKWLGSDYMTQSVGLDPAVTHKRLGDGFYEQKLIREQIASLTGKRFLGDYTSDEQEYQALMDNGITFAKQYNLRPGIALSDAQLAALTSDMVWLVEQSVTLADGTVQKVLAPQVYVRVQPGDIDGNGAVMSGKQVSLALSGDLTNAGTIAGRDVMQINADNINNLSGRLQASDMTLAALQDINNVGCTISATNSISATAGRDINLQSTTQTTTGEQGSRTQLDRVAALYVSGASATLAVNAGRDINAQAALIQNAGTGATSLEAVNNINLSTVNTAQSNTIEWDANNRRSDSQSAELGTSIQSAGNLTLKAGQTVSATAADVQAAGALNVDAKNIQLQAGQATQSVDELHQHTSKGFLSKTTETTQEASSSSTAVGSSFGGATVSLKAANDIDIKGSNVVGDNGTTLNAGNNVSIEAATNTNTSMNYKQTSQSGLMSGGSLLSISVGTRKQSLDQQDTSTTAAASNVGSVNGNVNITTGNQYKQVGSDVVAPNGDIAITAKTVDIQEARETNKQSIEQKFEQSGLTVAISSGLLDNLQGAQKQQQAASQTKDTRMKTLAVANQAANVAAAVQDVSRVDVSVSLGSSSSESKQSSQSDTARGSAVKAGGSTTIQAIDGGEASNLNIQGSDVSGKEVNLEADNKVNLLVAQNTTTQISISSSNSSASVGGSIGTSGLGITASAALGKGNGNGTDTTYTDTHVRGTDKVTIKSGGDTNVKGATVEGNQVTANVDGNLNIESLQDTSTYAEKNTQVGGSVMVGISDKGPVKGNITVVKSNINSNYASVKEQSGLKAGDGGFTVNVQGNTDLKGAAITSTQAAIDNNKNTFNTDGKLTTSDIENKASYNAKSISVTVGTGSTPGQSASAGMSGVGFGSDSGNASSTTTAGISGIAGDTTKRTGDAQQGIKQIFNHTQVKAEIGAQTVITAEFGKNASKAVGDYAAIKLKEVEKNKDPAGIEAWREGGSSRVALHTLVGGLTGGTVGAVGAGTSQAAIDQIGQAIKDTDLSVELKQVLVAAAGTSVGVAASVGSVAGGATAFNATVNNYLSRAELEKLNDTKRKCSGGDAGACSDQKRLEALDKKRDDDYANAYDQCRTTKNCKSLTNLDNQMQRDMEWAGGLSKNYESKNDPGAINAKQAADGTWYLPPDKNSKLDPGGFSYGSYQIETQKGTMRDFMNFLKGSDPESYRTLQTAGGYEAAKAGKPEFITAWQNLARDTGFNEQQHNFVDTRKFQSAYNYAEQLIPNLEQRSDVLKEIIWSGAVQHGNVSEGVLKGAWNNSADASDEQLIRQFYSQRLEYANGLKNVSDMTARYELEMKKALDWLSKPRGQWR